MKTQQKPQDDPTPIAARIAAQNVRILLERQKSGKALSRSELAQIERYLAEREHKSERKEFAKSMQDLAGIFQTNRETIRLWLKAGAPRPTGSGFYPIDEWRDWVKANGKEITADEGLDKARLTCRQMLLKIQKMEIEVERARGALMHVDEVRAKVFQSFDTVRRLQLRLGASLASRLAGLEPAEIETEITRAIEESYDAIRVWAEEMASQESKPQSQVTQKTGLAKAKQKDSKAKAPRKTRR